ncbi:MAG: YicC family protein [Hyphomicrobiaceae bacterium]|nr:YicC family protein [Hyphomicrobiaceae bacterium]
MTGFGRHDGITGDVIWHWEVRSVNGRGLDVRTRLPAGYEMLDQSVRQAVAKSLSRGNVNVQFSIQRAQGATEIRLNEDALRQVMTAVTRARELTGAPAVPLEALLQIKGVLEVAEPVEDDESRQARQAEMLGGLECALADLVAARATEGTKLAAVLTALLDEVATLVDTISKSPSRSAEVVAKRLKDNLRRLMEESGAALDQDRLHQEAVLLAGKADVEEELQRLSAHVSAARELIARSEPVGRKLDFLTQEFNREANTICSKANDIEVTRAGLALKAAIEQIREQVQNIE